MSPWLWLLLGVVSNSAGSVALKANYGLTIFGLSLIGFMLAVFSVDCWGMTLRLLPLGSSYIVWEGLGTIAAVLLGIIFFQEKLTLLVFTFACMVLIGSAGLYYTAQSESHL